MLPRAESLVLALLFQSWFIWLSLLTSCFLPLRMGMFTLYCCVLVFIYWGSQIAFGLRKDVGHLNDIRMLEVVDTLSYPKCILHYEMKRRVKVGKLWLSDVFICQITKGELVMFNPDCQVDGGLESLRRHMYWHSCGSIHREAYLMWDGPPWTGAIPLADWIKVRKGASTSICLCFLTWYDGTSSLLLPHHDELWSKISHSLSHCCLECHRGKKNNQYSSY